MISCLLWFILSGLFCSLILITLIHKCTSMNLMPIKIKTKAGRGEYGGG